MTGACERACDALLTAAVRWPVMALVLLGCSGRPQVWMAAFDSGRAVGGEDPGFPAFRLPFQDSTTNNHIAQWTEEVVDIR